MWGKLPLVWSLWEQEVHHTGSQESTLHVQNTWYWHSLHLFHLRMVQALNIPCPSPGLYRLTLTGSKCGITTCSLFPPEQCWREQMQDHVRSAAFWRAGKQESHQGEGSSPLNRVATALYFWYHSLSYAVGIALLPVLIHNWKLLAF